MFAARKCGCWTTWPLWPRVAWMDFREPQFWDACTALAAGRGLLTFPATPQGLLDMSRALLTEQGPRSGSRVARRSAATPRSAGLPLAQLVEQVLGDALPWAQACAMLPAVPHRLGDALRRRFHPDVPATSWGRLQALPRTGRDAEGWHLADDVRQILRRGFFAQRSVAQARQVLEFVRQQIQTTGRLLPPDSLARFACEGVLLRLSIQEGSIPDAEQTARLTQSDLPIADAVTLDLRRRPRCSAASARLTPEQSRVLEDLKIIPRCPSPYPDDLVRIPAGPFRMGDPTEEGDGDERPQHPVEVSTFYIAKHPVTWQLWQEVYGWAVEHGYQFDNRGAGRGPDHPVTNVSWYDAVKWCNARSEKEGRRPAYYTDASHTEPYRQGQLDLPAEAVDWTGQAVTVADRSRMGEGGPRRLGGTSLPVGEPGQGLRTVHLAGQGELRQEQEERHDAGGHVSAQRLRTVRHGGERVGLGLGPLGQRVVRQTRRNDGRYTWSRLAAWTACTAAAAGRTSPGGCAARTATGGTRRMRTATWASVLPEVRLRHRQRSSTKAESEGRGTRPRANRRSRAERTTRV